MPCRIIPARSHEPLQQGWQARSFAPAGTLLDQTIEVRGLTFEERYHPVRVSGRTGVSGERPRAQGFNYRRLGPVVAYCLRSDFEDEKAIERLRRDRSQDVIGVFADPSVSIFPSASCGSPVAAGVAAALRQKFSTEKLAPAQLKGLLQRTARDLEGNGWDYDMGYGVISGAAAVRALSLKRVRK